MSNDQGWVRGEFARARERYANVPSGARPVVSGPSGSRPSSSPAGSDRNSPQGRYAGGPHPAAMPPMQPVKKKLNAFFVMLTVISALPTLFFGLAWVLGGGGTSLAGLAMLWSGAWTYVWWSLRHR